MSSKDKIRKQVLHRLKNLSENITDSVGEMSKGKSPFCSKDSINQRMSLCNACPHFVKTTTQCKRCGCFMSAKTKLKHASCPIGKWGKDI